MNVRCYVGGTFDLFHPGHVELLKRCNRLGEVWVSLNTDEFAARYKRPTIMTLEERTVMLGACRYVTQVVVNEGDEDSKPAILGVRPRYIVHGTDWQGFDLMRQMGLTVDFLKEHGIGLVYQPYTEGISSSDIIKRCDPHARLDRDVSRAAREHGAATEADLQGILENSNEVLSHWRG